MPGTTTNRVARRRVAAALAVCLLGIGLAALAALPASAHEDDSDQASVLVLQAIGLIVNAPDDMDGIGDKIDDALNAPEKEGVDLAQVQAAKDALEQDMDQARALLQESLESGAPMEAATGEETGTTVVHDSLDTRGDVARGDWVLLVLSVVAVALGVLLAVRYRPRESVRVLRRQLTTPPSDSTPSS